jgi:hypothetical protein
MEAMEASCCVGRADGSPQAQLERGAMGRAPVGNSDQRLLSILEDLERCEAGLRTSGHLDTAHLVSLAMLELRMRLNEVSDADLKALCDEMLPEGDVSAEHVGEVKSSASLRRRPLLRLIK